MPDAPRPPNRDRPDGRHWAIRPLLGLLLTLAALAGFGPAARAQTCPADLAADEPAHCRYFVAYTPLGAAKADDRIASRLAGTPTPARPLRSFALVIGIDDYPNFQSVEDRTLPPARNDLANLVGFLKEQQFDEIIVLHNAEATKDNINHFLDVYLNKQLDVFGAGSRVFIAHTGHGGPGSGVGAPGSIILSSATGPRDYPNVYALNEIAPKLRNLAAKSFHFVALLGSCYSGGIFSAQAAVGSNDWYPGAPGAHAVSSTPHDDLAYGLGGGNGSILFDTLIAGTRSGEADILYAGWTASGNGDLHRIGGGIVRLGALAAYVSGRIDALGVNPQTKKPFPQILLGSLSGSDHAGAFFFLGPPKEQRIGITRNGRDAIVATNDTGSSVIANSDIKVFSPPDSYQVSGIDVSHYNEAIDWPSAAKGISFAYMKATESVTLTDAFFARNWTGAAQAGLLRGAYHVFDYCEDVGRQFENVRRTVPKDGQALPVAIDLQWRDGPANPRQARCGAIAGTRARLLDLAARIEAEYGKVPVIFANSSGLNDLIGDDFIRYPIWLQQYDAPSKNPLDALRIKGRNPWTFWQYTETGRIAGIKGPVDRNVFFGTRDVLKAFALGSGNPALRAAAR